MAAPLSFAEGVFITASERGRGNAEVRQVRMHIVEGVAVADERTHIDLDKFRCDLTIQATVTYAQTLQAHSGLGEQAVYETKWNTLKVA